MKKKTFLQMARDGGFLNQRELMLKSGSDDKTLKLIDLPKHYCEGLNKPRYKWSECKPLIKDWLTEKDRKFIFNKKCKVCSSEFSYEKIIFCTGWTERYINNHIDTYDQNRNCCSDECRFKCNARIGTCHTEEEKQHLRECMINWWENVSTQKRTAMRKKCSDKKYLYWQKIKETK
jgi:hypothetical protein